MGEVTADEGSLNVLRPRESSAGHLRAAHRRCSVCRWSWSATGDWRGSASANDVQSPR